VATVSKMLSAQRIIKSNFYAMLADLEVLIIQKGNNIIRNITHEIAKSPKQMLAAISFSEYLKSLAASRKTSLVSCNARIIVPIRKNLHTTLIYLYELLPKSNKLIKSCEQEASANFTWNCTDKISSGMLKFYLSKWKISLAKWMC